MEAARRGNVGEVRVWLRRWADANHARFRPLFAAAAAGHADVVDVLLTAGADPRATDEAAPTALDQAAAHPDVAARLRTALARR